MDIQFTHTDMVISIKYIKQVIIVILNIIFFRSFKTCTGSNDHDIPPGTSGATGAIIEDSLYIFGGFCDQGNRNNIYRLDLSTCIWTRLKPDGIRPLKCDKCVSWEYKNKFYIFGGYGLRIRDSQEINCKFIIDPNSHWVSPTIPHLFNFNGIETKSRHLQNYRRGWNNQLAFYDPDLNSWIWPESSGSCPSPRAAHAAVRLGSNVFILGGRHSESRLNDLYSYNLETSIWTQLLDASIDPNIPVGRSWHSFTAISMDAIALYGGFSHDNEILDDCWLFFVSKCKWTRLNLKINKPRLWHSAIFANNELIIYGGGQKNILNFQNTDVSKTNSGLNSMNSSLSY